MLPQQQPITPEAYECLLQANHSLQQQNDVYSRNIQTLCQHNGSLMKHIENLHQTILSLGTENTALRRDYEVLRTKFNDCEQNSDHSFTPERKLEKEEKTVVLQGDEEDVHKEIQQFNFNCAAMTEDDEDQSQKGSFLRGKKFWQGMEKGSLQQATERGKQDFKTRRLSYRKAIEGSEEQSLFSAFQSKGENFLKTRTFWEVKEKGSSQQRKNEKEKDLKICDMAVKCKGEKEEAMGRGKQDFEKQMLRPPPYHEAMKGTEEQSPFSAFQSKGENFLKTLTFWESKEKGTSYQDKDNLKKVDMTVANENLLKSHEKEESLEHINRRVPEEDMCRQELSMNLVGLKAEVESLEQDKESVKEHENSTDLSDQSKEQKEEAEYQALLEELKDIQVKIATHQDFNRDLQSNAKEREDKLEQVLKEAKDELDSVPARNNDLIRDTYLEREMTGVLNATVEDLEERCGKLLLIDFLKRNKHQKEMRSRREPELWQWEANRWGDS